MNVLDITAPAGYEVSEVSDAKDIVLGELYYLIDDLGSYHIPEDSDLLKYADRIVSVLIDSGWRPTK